MSTAMLIHGGTIVNEGRRFRGWVLVQGGLIVEVGEGEYPFIAEFRGTGGGGGKDGNGGRGGEIIDATGKIVMPGVIDPHVHFREPGLTHKGDMATESAAAVAGGVTSVLEMPNTSPPTVSMDALEAKFALAAGRMHTNYSFFLGATNDNAAEIQKFRLASSQSAGMPQSSPPFCSPIVGSAVFSGGCGVKLFIGSSTGGMLVDSDYAISKLFAEYDGVVVAHCEDENIIRANTSLYRGRLGEGASAAIHPSVRSAEACYRATARAVELADKYGARLHVAHLTTARELSLFEAGGNAAAGRRAKRITAEACVPHLWFTDTDYPRLGNLIKCNPAIKSAEDRNALREALSTGKIDLIATDHAPHTLQEKSRGYWDAPSGMPFVQHSLPAMMELAGQGVLPVEAVVEKMCHAPAVLFGVVGRGFLRAGYSADITIVDPSAEWVVEPENILYKCGWSPLEGTVLHSRVACTIVNGTIVYNDGRVTDTVAGERLQFTR